VRIASYCGEVTGVKIIPNKSCGFVDFTYYEHAVNCIWRCQGAVIGNSRVRMSWGKKNQKNGPTEEMMYYDPYIQQKVLPSAPFESYPEFGYLMPTGYDPYGAALQMPYVYPTAAQSSEQTLSSHTTQPQTSATSEDKSNSRITNEADDRANIEQIDSVGDPDLSRKRTRDIEKKDLPDQPEEDSQPIKIQRLDKETAEEESTQKSDGEEQIEPIQEPESQTSS